jgi:hypothetical protein
MKIWTAMKRLNRRYDAWALRAAGRFVADLDRRFGDDAERGTTTHLNVWDLLSKKRGPGR